SSRSLIKISPKIRIPNLVAINEKVTQRRFYFAETGHFNFAATAVSCISLIMELTASMQAFTPVSS
ncbi:hypothetical protein, partial [Phyllobacterium calauticae]|uniref:hypothetical protein n=1 Tax=Phyllobacterium calauticae TaxID=2817027 RepID=UPI001CBEC6BA